MTTTCDFVTYDVFTQGAYSGNPLAIVHLPPAGGPEVTQDQKQKIAREFNYAETVFIHARREGKDDTTIDIFTRFQEITFAGHPVIGTAHYLREYLASGKDKTPENELRMVIKAGDVHVQFDESGLAIAEVPHNLRTHKESVGTDDILTQQSELADSKPNLPPQCPVISSVKGMTNVIIDVSLAEGALNRLLPVKPPSNIILDQDFSPSRIGTHFYSKLKSSDSTERYQVRRFMSDGVEDPATGSAASALAGYLSLKKGNSEGRYRYEMIQGEEMGRRSDIFVDVELDSTGAAVSKIYLSGHAVKIMEGKLTVPDS